MELRHLRYFVAVAEELHFGRAAARLNIMQPPLSQQIRKLEEDLGVQLFYRTKHHVELTDAGKILLEHAYLILEQVSIASDTVRRASLGETGQLIIGFSGYLMYDILPQILQAYRKKFPNVKVVPLQFPTTDQIQALHDKKIQVGILCTPVESTLVNTRLIHRQPFIIALPENHPQAAESSAIDIQELAKDPFIFTPRKSGSSYYDVCISICNQAGFSPYVTQEANEVQTVIALVAAGVGVALVPYSAKSRKVEGVVFRDLKGTDLTIQTSVAWRQDEKSQVVRSFMTIVDEYLISNPPLYS